MSSTLILDAEAMSTVARSSPRDGRAHKVLGHVRIAYEQGRDVFVPAAVLAELYRGGSHDQVVDACLKRFSSIRVVHTDRPLAREVGHLLARAGRGSADHVDASVVAAAVKVGGGVIATADVEDISALAHGVRGVRVLGV